MDDALVSLGVLEGQVCAAATEASPLMLPGARSVLEMACFHFSLLVSQLIVSFGMRSWIGFPQFGVRDTKALPW